MYVDKACLIMLESNVTYVIMYYLTVSWKIFNLFYWTVFILSFSYTLWVFIVFPFAYYLLFISPSTQLLLLFQTGEDSVSKAMAFAAAKAQTPSVASPGVVIPQLGGTAIPAVLPGQQLSSQQVIILIIKGGKIISKVEISFRMC